MVRFRVSTRPESRSIAPNDAQIVVDNRGAACLHIDGSPAIRADRLEDLLKQLQLTADEIEPT